MSWSGGQPMSIESESEWRVKDSRPCGTLATRMNPCRP